MIFVKDKPSDAAEADPDNVKRSVLESIMKRDVFTPARECNGFRCRETARRPSYFGSTHRGWRRKAHRVRLGWRRGRFLSKRHSTYTDPVALIMLTESSSDDFAVKAAKIMKMRAYDIATHGVISIDVHTDIREVCRVLGENHLKKVPVTDEGQLVGVINRSDIAHYSMRKYLEQNESELAQTAATA